MSEKTYGHIEGKLSIEIAGNRIDLGYITVPVTGFRDGYSLRLGANLLEVKDAVQEIFNQTAPTNKEDQS